jgi:putative DNA primase/helicase
MLTITPELIPGELKELRRWLVAKLEVVNGRKTKVPYNPNSPAHKASSTDPATWSDFATAYARVQSGAFPMIGFALDGSGYSFIDFDHCVDEHGEIAPPRRSCTPMPSSST